ncbi:hypothetical protein CEXT_496351 [Caerostris extrusa]|uniref:Ycf15 n=1 Tax=Caerostris extrusa TaxID=172846 RepID=A0AAV4MFY3_CAEEX|nr:hypothetical protein CEXT_496351 [Caerostris extrusa]
MSSKNCQLSEMAYFPDTLLIESESYFTQKRSRQSPNSVIGFVFQNEEGGRKKKKRGARVVEPLSILVTPPLTQSAVPMSNVCNPSIADAFRATELKIS